MSDDTDRDDGHPSLVVVRGGEPTAEELAALVVAMGAVAGAPDARPQPRSGWADRRAHLRRPLDHGPGRWAASARPTLMT